MPITKTEWTMRFAARLRKIRMNAGGLSAMLTAVNSYDANSNLEPEEAADSYASETPPDDPGTGGD